MHLPLHYQSLANDKRWVLCVLLNHQLASHLQPPILFTQQLRRYFRTQIRSTSFMIYRFLHILPLDCPPLSSLCPLAYYNHTGFLWDLLCANFHVPPSQFTHMLFPGLPYSLLSPPPLSTSCQLLHIIDISMEVSLLRKGYLT